MNILSEQQFELYYKIFLEFGFKFKKYNLFTEGFGDEQREKDLVNWMKKQVDFIKKMDKSMQSDTKIIYDIGTEFYNLCNKLNRFPTPEELKNVMKEKHGLIFEK